MRSRYAKPGYFKDGDLARCQPLARILFLGLSCLADRDGRLRDKPVEIKAEVLPHDAIDIDGLLNELHGARLIARYAVDGVRLIQVSKSTEQFQKHARPHPNEFCEELPPPPAKESCNYTAECALTLPSSLSLSSDLRSGDCPERSQANASGPPESPVSVGRKRPTKRPLDDASPVVMTFPCCGMGSTYESPLPWDLKEKKLAEYRASFPGLDVLAESRKALQWCRDNPAKRKTPRGMPAFLARWMTRAQDRGGMPGKGPPPPPMRTPEQREKAIRQKREASEADRQKVEAERDKLQAILRARTGVGRMPE